MTRTAIATADPDRELALWRIRSALAAWAGSELCHRCGIRPGTERFYVPNPHVALSGTQIKFSARRTIGCDKCWAEFRNEGRRESAG